SGRALRLRAPLLRSDHRAQHRVRRQDHAARGPPQGDDRRRRPPRHPHVGRRVGGGRRDAPRLAAVRRRSPPDPPPPALPMVLDAPRSGWSWWNYDRRPDNWTSPVNTTAMIDLLRRPQPSRVMGRLETISFDAATGAFAFSYTEERGVAPTEVRVPAEFATRK